MKYEEAISELDEIVRKVESGALDIDQLTATLKRAKELVAFCRDTLYKTDAEVKALLDDEEKS